MKHSFLQTSFRNISDFKVMCLNRFLRDFFMTASVCCHQIAMCKRLVSSHVQQAVHMNCALGDMVEDWLQRKVHTNLFSQAIFVYSSWWWSLSYFSTSCQQLSLPLSPGQCSTERPHLLWVGRSGKDAGHSTINLDSTRKPGHCPGGEFRPRGKIIKRHKKTFLPFRGALRLLSTFDSFNSSPDSSFPSCHGPPHHRRHGEYEICLRWMIADWICAYWTLNICNISNIIIFLHTHRLISIIVCGVTQIGENNRVNKEMSMIIKAEINNTLSLTICVPVFPSISIHLSPSFCFGSVSFIWECFIGSVRFSLYCQAQ